MHSNALIILLHLLQLDLLLLTKTELIPSPTAQSRGGKIIQYSRTVYGFQQHSACCCRFLRPSGASEGEKERGRRMVMSSSESGEMNLIVVMSTGSSL